MVDLCILKIVSQPKGFGIFTNCNDSPKCAYETLTKERMNNQ